MIWRHGLERALQTRQNSYLQSKDSLSTFEFASGNSAASAFSQATHLLDQTLAASCPPAHVVEILDIQGPTLL